MRKLQSLLCVFVLLSIVGWGPFSFFGPSNSEKMGSSAWIEKETSIISGKASNFEPDVIRYALRAYTKARSQGFDPKQILTIVNYKKASDERRLLVYDVKNNRVLFNTWVTHGRNSGKLVPTSFSNQNGSLKSSIGVFVTTSEAYMGENGYSLRVQGLEHGINDHAYQRAIVFHGAWYAEGDVAKQRGVLGRSWGCFAVGEHVIKPLIETIKDNTVVVAYYPDRHWLRDSRYLAG